MKIIRINMANVHQSDLGQKFIDAGFATGAPGLSFQMPPVVTNLTGDVSLEFENDGCVAVFRQAEESDKAAPAAEETL